MAASSSVRPIEILVVNDQAQDRRYLSTLFRYQGFVVFEAADALTALSLLERHRPDLVISGARVPPVGGFEFVRRLRATPGTTDLPIVFYAEGVHEREARAVAEMCGVHDILTRTSPPGTIVDRVHALLARVGPGAPPASAEGAPPSASLQLIDMVRELSAAEQQLTAVSAICQQLTREHAPHALLSSVLQALRTITSAEYAAGGVFDDVGQDGPSRASCGPDASLVAALEHARLADAVRVSVLRRVTMRWDREGHDVRLFDETEPAVRIHGGLLVPLATPSRVYGWVAAINRTGASRFTDRDEQAAGVLGAQAGIAYENAVLIAELQRRTHQLQTAAVHTTFALEAARTGVWTWELPGRAWLASDALGTVLDLQGDQRIRTLDDLLGLVIDEDRARVERTFAESADGRSSLNVEFTIQRPGGSPRVLQAQGRVSQDAEGRAARMHGVLVDVTDRRLLEAQLRQAQRIETVGLLAGGIAHDFNNMLTAILGYARLAEEQLAHGASPLTEIQQISKAAERASLLTRQLLTFSRQQMLERVRLDLNAIIEDLAAMLGRLIGDHIQITLALDASRPAVLGDRSRIEQVVMNLVVNARDAMPNGGRVEIATATVWLTGDDQFAGAAAVPGRYAVLSISDTGSGIADGVKDRIFDPFFTTKEHGRGTGLGLATVHGIVRQAQGYVDVLSEAGRGSTFLTYLPALDPVDDPGTHAMAPGRPRGGTERVLVVEDEHEVRRLVRTVLERVGYRVADAANTSEAERILASSDAGFELLITDIVMPGGTGADLYRRLAQVRPSMRVVFMSGYADDQAVAEAAAQPGTVFLQKPFAIDTLVRRVREALDQ